MEEDVYFIDFTTNDSGGGRVTLDAVRVRLDMVRITESQMSERMRVDLCEHPLYEELQRYVKANPR